jgi:hypothetical protein
MARTEPTNINHCVAPSITSRASSLTKDSIQRNDEIKTEFTSREGTYKISSLIDNLGKIGTSTCLNEPVKITLLSRIQTVLDTNSRQSSSINNIPTENSILSNGTESNQQNGNLLLTDILAFNVGRELIIYEFTEATQVLISYSSITFVRDPRCLDNEWTRLSFLLVFRSHIFPMKSF